MNTVQGQSLEDFRYDEFAAMGFSEEQARILAQASELENVTLPLDVHRVRHMIGAGCTHDQAMRIVI